MELAELAQWSDEFEGFHARFADLFCRQEPREQSRKYLRSLLAPVERKNGWQLAETIGDKTPDATQRLLYQETIPFRGQETFRGCGGTWSHVVLKAGHASLRRRPAAFRGG